MFIQKKSAKVLRMALIVAMSMGVFLPVAAKNKEVTRMMDIPEEGQCSLYAIRGFVVGAVDGAARAFTSAYLNRKIFGKSWLAVAGSRILTHGSFEIIQRTIMTPKTTVYNAPYYAGLITTTIGLTPKFASREETVTEIGDSIKKTSGMVTKWLLGLCTKGINILNNAVNPAAKNTPEVHKTA